MKFYYIKIKDFKNAPLFTFLAHCARLKNQCARGGQNAPLSRKITTSGHTVQTHLFLSTFISQLVYFLFACSKYMKNIYLTNVSFWCRRNLFGSERFPLNLGLFRLGSPLSWWARLAAQTLCTSCRGWRGAADTATATAAQGRRTRTRSSRPRRRSRQSPSRQGERPKSSELSNFGLGLVLIEVHARKNI